MGKRNLQERQRRSCGSSAIPNGCSSHFDYPCPHGLDRFGPCARAALEAGIELPSLTGAFTDSAGGQPEDRGSGFDLRDQLVSFRLHGGQGSVIFHTKQAGISHSPARRRGGISLTMDQNETFRENLLAALAESGMTEAELSIKAGLNRRAVTDIRERRTVSPKISTVFALAQALHRDPGELLGIGQRYQLDRRLAEFLEQFGPEDQARFLDALTALPRPRAE